tara:strand:- start:1165 stop:2619 length:1455 start_codon:yes stop_codon:yes gene_type:complete
MSVIIEQQPLYRTLPVGQDIIFTVSEDVIVATKYNVKFVAQVYVADSISNLGTINSLVSTLKVTPNNTGVGIFSLQPILESYVNPQNEGVDLLNQSISTYKGVDYSLNTPHPIHLIDKYCTNKNNSKFFAVDFNIEYYDTADLIRLITLAKPFKSINFLVFNGVLDYDSVLKKTGNNYGFNLNGIELVMATADFYTGQLGKFITNAPSIQYARLTDYGTFSFFNYLNGVIATGSIDGTRASYINITLYDNAGGLLGNVIRVDCNIANGGWDKPNSLSSTRVMFFGVFPANLDGAAYSDWVTNRANIAYYTVQVYDEVEVAISRIYTINIVDNACKGFEAIRLTWLNQWGTWDYYTFRKKSVKSLQTNRTNYTQQGGTWNESTFRINGYKGGKKNFRVNTKQLITINTDFILDSEAVWFEDLINSTDVYLLNEYSSTDSLGITNKYVEPVRVTDSSYIRKTKVNDKLIQYTFNIEKTHNKRTHSV